MRRLPSGDEEDDLDAAFADLGGMSPSEVPAVSLALKEVVSSVHWAPESTSNISTAPKWPSSRRALAWSGAVAIILGTVIAVPSASNISSLFAEGGIFSGAPESNELSSSSNWITPDPHDADKVPANIIDLYPVWMPLPGGLTPQVVIAAVARTDSGNSNVPAPPVPRPTSTTSDAAIVSSFELAGTCAWYREWLDAAGAGSAQLRDNAAIIMGSAMTWPAFTASDSETLVNVLSQSADAASKNDEVSVKAGYAELGCDALVTRMMP